MKIELEMASLLHDMANALANMQANLKTAKAKLDAHQAVEYRKIKLASYEAYPGPSDLTRQIMVVAVTKPDNVMGYDYRYADQADIQSMLNAMMREPVPYPHFDVYINAGDEAEVFFTHVKKGSKRGEINALIRQMILDKTYKELVI